MIHGAAPTATHARDYSVNNYPSGEKPPAFDILARSVGGTNLPGALHCHFLDIFQDNILVKP